MIKSKVSYSAVDSIIYDMQKEQIRLYGKAEVKYEDINLQSGYILINWTKNLIFAKALEDSTGKLTNFPVFVEGDTKYESKEMAYNYETKEGNIKELFTQEGEGYIHGKKVYKSDEDHLFVKNGKYTTCANKDPHFHFNISKLKVVPDQIVAAGLSNLVVEDVPTPLMLPFGIFPLKKGRKSGILIPEYGESPGFGFFLKNGGYYFGISEHFDLAIRGDIYSRGSWRLNAASNYVKRYKYRGNFSVNYATNKIGYAGDSDFSLNKDFLIRWNHKQDPKARPGSIFNANVNFGTKSYHFNNSTNANDFLQSNMQSSISYSKQLLNKRANLSINLRHAQNNGSNNVNFSLPDLAFNVSRVQPFKKIGLGNSKSWYKKLGFNYTLNIKNDINIVDTILYKKLMERDLLSNTIDPNTLVLNPDYYDDPIEWGRYMQNGIKQSIPFNTSFNKFHINFSPYTRYTQRIYFNEYEESWDAANDVLMVDTMSGLYMIHEYSAGINVNTRLYGHLPINAKRLKALWHVVTPRASIQFKPDFSNENWGYYGYYEKADNMGGVDSIKYSKFKGIYGNASQGRQSKLNFSLDNFLEAKIMAKKDSVFEEKKIKIFENISLASAYNWAADSLHIDPLNLNVRTSLFKNKLNFNLRGVYDPYCIDSNNVRKNEFYTENSAGLLRFSSLNFSFNANFASPRNKKKTSDLGSEAENQMVHYYPELFVDFDVPWRFGFRYNLNMNNQYIQRSNGEKVDSNLITQNLGFNFDVNITPKWKIAATSGYDFTNKEIAYTTIDIYRDLHCWELKIQWVPLGTRKSYSFALSVKAPILQDLKLQKRRNWFDY